MELNTVQENVNKIISELNGSIKIISGTCRGADQLGEKFALDNRIELERFPADWGKFGRRAGYIRNVEMAKYASGFSNGILIAFWDGNSKGTKHMIDIAKKHGLAVHVINY